MDIKKILEKDILSEEEVKCLLFSDDISVLYNGDSVFHEGYKKLLIYSGEYNIIKNVYLTEETHRKILNL